MIVLVRLRDGADRVAYERFSATVDRWIQVHAPAVVRVHDARLLRHACNIGLAADYSGWAPDEAPAWDGIAESWYDVEDPAELVALFAATSARLRDGERQFIGTSQ